VTENSVEEHLKEESFGSVDCLFYDYRVAYELNDVSIIGWPEKYVLSDNNDMPETLSNVLTGTREIIRDLSRCMEITFTDVYALEVLEEGWEAWDWDAKRVPKLGVGKMAKCNYPILKVKNSKWKNKTFPDWNRDWVSETSHWRLISCTNSVDICARSAVGRWRAEA
jgi:hypothetical protein